LHFDAFFDVDWPFVLIDMFKIPKIGLQERNLFSKEDQQLPKFSWQDLSDKDEVGHGAFGAVFTANYHNSKVVVKKLLGSDQNERKRFLKEARLLNGFNNKNIVEFKGICSSPMAIMLEYLYFDFAPFVENKDLRASSLEDFFTSLDDMDAVDSFSVQDKIVSDVASGLMFLHSCDCYHRDLKTANILVSNQHYCSLKKDEIAEAFHKEPIICKLTDFGESRASEVQTAVVKSTCATKNVERGTPSYMAPEIVVDTKMSEARSVDLKRIDIWALGMVIFCVLNPNISFPYKHDLEVARAASKRQFNAVSHIKGLLEQQRKPTGSSKYQHLQETKCSHLVKAY
jgi:serine/threonine protein kinase